MTLPTTVTPSPRRPAPVPESLRSPIAILQPEMLESRTPVIGAGGAERMDVFLTHVFPVLEGDAELEGGLGGRHEVLFLHLEQAQVGHQWRNGRFPDPHGPDLLRFDQGNVEYLAHGPDQQGGRHPACGAPAGNHYFLYPLVQLASS